MAGQDGSSTHSLTARLRESPHRFDFFQAVRRLECTARERPRVGRARRPGQEAVRFGQLPSLAFAPGTMAGWREGTNGLPPRVLVNFFGLLGPNGPMPLHLTEYVHSRQLNYHDQALADFLDLFHHRMIALFYRAWACNRPTVDFDRPDDARFALYIGSLFGLGQESLQQRDAVPDVAKLHYAGRLVPVPRHPEGLRAIIRDYFRLPAQIEEFVGQWVPLPGDCQCRLGEAPATGLLGRTVVVGSSIWDCQQKFRVRLGPMTYAEYERMLPDGKSVERLRDWVRLYAGDALVAEVQLVLKASEVPATKLGSLGRLGWSTWLVSEPVEKDADDLILKLVA